MPVLAGEYPRLFIYGPVVFSAATETILGDNGVRSQGSPDAMRIWVEHR